METRTQFTTAPEEAQLIEAARMGDMSGLVEHLYGKLRAHAWRLVESYRAVYGTRPGLDVDDLAQEGMEAMLISLAGALATDHPIARLMVVGKYRMLHYCQENRVPIRVPNRSQSKGATVPTVFSLDAPLDGYDMLTLADLLPA